MFEKLLLAVEAKRILRVKLSVPGLDSNRYWILLGGAALMSLFTRTNKAYAEHVWLRDRLRQQCLAQQYFSDRDQQDQCMHTSFHLKNQ